MKNYRKLFAYIVVFLLALIFLLASSNANGFDFDRVLSSLGTAFMAAFLLFVFTDIFFDADAQLGERFEKIIRLLDHSHDVFQNEAASFPDVRERLKSFQQLDVIGYALDQFLSSHDTEIIEGIRDRGARVRVITIDPDSIAGQAADAYSGGVQLGVQKTENVINSIRRQVGPEHAQQIECIQIDRPPHINAVIIDPHKNNAVLRLVLYELTGPTIHGTDRMCLMMNRMNDTKWLQYFVKEFNKVWDEWMGRPNMPSMP